jgi:hypothetical protein
VKGKGEECRRKAFLAFAGAIAAIIKPKST